jgi:hypothetical protein
MKSRLSSYSKIPGFEIATKKLRHKDEMNKPVRAWTNHWYYSYVLSTSNTENHLKAKAVELRT